MNQNRRLSQRFVRRSKRLIQLHLKMPDFYIRQLQLFLLTAPHAGLFYCFFPTGSPVNGSIYSFIFILSAIISSVIWFLYTPLFSLCFFLLYLQNILCTKNAYSHTYTSNLHVCRISLVNFFP